MPKFNHKKSEIEGLTQEEIKSLDILCSMVVNSNWFPVLINFLLNEHIATVLAENSIRGANDRPLITDDKFRGWLEKIIYFQDFILSRGKLQQQLDQEVK